MATPASVTEAESKNINAALRLLGTIPQAIPMSVAAPLAGESSSTWHRHHGQAKDAMREMQRRRLTLLQDKSWAAEETLARSHDYWQTVTNWLKYSKAPHIHRLWKDITTTHGTCDAAAIADTLTYIFNSDGSTIYRIIHMETKYQYTGLVEERAPYNRRSEHIKAIARANIAMDTADAKYKKMRSLGMEKWIFIPMAHSSAPIEINRLRRIEKSAIAMAPDAFSLNNYDPRARYRLDTPPPSVAEAPRNPTDSVISPFSFSVLPPLGTWTCHSSIPFDAPKNTILMIHKSDIVASMTTTIVRRWGHRY